MQKLIFSALAGVLMGAGFQSLAGDHNGAYEYQKRQTAEHNAAIAKKRAKEREAERKKNLARIRALEKAQKEYQRAVAAKAKDKVTPRPIPASPAARAATAKFLPTYLPSNRMALAWSPIRSDTGTVNINELRYVQYLVPKNLMIAPGPAKSSKGSTGRR